MVKLTPPGLCANTAKLDLTQVFHTLPPPPPVVEEEVTWFLTVDRCSFSVVEIIYSDVQIKHSVYIFRYKTMMVISCFMALYYIPTLY